MEFRISFCATPEARTDLSELAGDDKLSLAIATDQRGGNTVYVFACTKSLPHSKSALFIPDICKIFCASFERDKQLVNINHTNSIPTSLLLHFSLNLSSPASSLKSSSLKINLNLRMM